jgi:hypothetical protein
MNPVLHVRSITYAWFGAISPERPRFSNSAARFPEFRQMPAESVIRAAVSAMLRDHSAGSN